MKQRTIKKVIFIKGKGLHTGKKIQLKMLPAIKNTGIIYRRVDLFPNIEFNMNIDMISTKVPLCTCLENRQNIRIYTIEHLNAAIAALGIDNVIIEVDAPEIPIMDGSASPFIFFILQSGIQELEEKKKFLKIKKQVSVYEEDKMVQLSPYEGNVLEFTIDFKHPKIKKKFNSFSIKFSTFSFIKEIGSARTFGFTRDIPYLHSLGMALGANFDCVVALNEKKILNKEGLRFKNEFVRHKILDAFGDLYVSGYNIIGRYTGFKSSHKMNNKLLKLLFKDEKNWEIISYNSEKNVPISFSYS
ncbi:UDP-3-O-acyl-N-acetylglucosamine deacetylase [bacterium endosymbiont of Pedicinus badii]|uniref:UDP-3-O-acyl-N-acetylglucosamine deacetylase n=1 Tax=bacterium endosymbiont of Pedicinus badii TaxID=1719126 RepID=UPI0009B95DBF|nr:UDP-3-O-acyl-N-acetylglucosamine deacetylase [bacterium endosymbiont of Pedicinus badii]OQM34225.1 UDP-3-O-[3-hydroxymyristoyl] N-acetylglucosamine deacetylase [bacterium endosymbiont of Pedicinus badii]